MSTPADRADPWARLRAATAARIGLGRCGAALPTAAMLELQYAHARARDAVHAPLPVEAVLGALAGIETRAATSLAADRYAYLTRPDLGRRLSPASLDVLAPDDAAPRPDLVIVLADGLSAAAAAGQGPPLVRALLERLPDWRVAPVVVALQARVALGDEIGERLGAALAVVLIGERPGLSAADSLGAYVTWDPTVGRLDSQRNCVSNIRPGGLDTQDAAGRIAWLLNAARGLRLTGVGLKDGYAPDALPVPSDARIT